MAAGYLDISINAEGVSIQPNGGRSVTVDLSEIKKGDVLDNFDARDIIEHFDTKALLDEMDKDTIKQHLDLVDAD